MREAEQRTGMALHQHAECVAIPPARAGDGDFVALLYLDFFHPAVRLD
jgi:hypothetical protein